MSSSVFSSKSLVHFIFYLCPQIQFCSSLLSCSITYFSTLYAYYYEHLLDWYVCQSSSWKNDILHFIHDVISAQTTLFSYVCNFCCYCCCHCQFPAAAFFLQCWPSSTVLCSLCSFFSVFAVLNYRVLQYQSLADQFPHCIPSFALQRYPYLCLSHSVPTYLYSEMLYIPLS